jgi:hypothetical protein
MSDTSTARSQIFGGGSQDLLSTLVRNGHEVKRQLGRVTHHTDGLIGFERFEEGGDLKFVTALLAAVLLLACVRESRAVGADHR